MYFCSAVQCDYGKEYKSCGSPIQPTCDNPYPGQGGGPNSTTIGCAEGCFCPDGFVLHGMSHFKPWAHQRCTSLKASSYYPAVP